MIATTKGEPPTSIGELRRLIVEDSIAKTGDRHPAYKKHEVMIAYLRHKHTNYEELLAQAEWWEYEQVKKACNERAEELLIIIRNSGY
jgi:hypothetical protein